MLSVISLSVIGHDLLSFLSSPWERVVFRFRFSKTTLRKEDVPEKITFEQEGRREFSNLGKDMNSWWQEGKERNRRWVARRWLIVAIWCVSFHLIGISENTVIG